MALRTFISFFVCENTLHKCGTTGCFETSQEIYLT